MDWRGSAALASSPSDRKSTRLNSSHGYISYAVFCLKKKNPSHPRQRVIESPAPDSLRAAPRNRKFLQQRPVPSISATPLRLEETHLSPFAHECPPQ